MSSDKPGEAALHNKENNAHNQQIVLRAEDQEFDAEKP